MLGGESLRKRGGRKEKILAKKEINMNIRTVETEKKRKGKERIIKEQRGYRWKSMMLYSEQVKIK